MKRTQALLAGAMIALGAISGQAQGQPPVGGAPPVPAATPTRTDKPRLAVFNVAKVMKEFNKWQYWSVVMQNKRFDAQMEMMRLRAEVMELQKQAETEPVSTKKEELARKLVVRQREFEDKERKFRTDLDAESSAALKTMYGEIQQAVKAIVESNGYDIVFSHMDATTPEEAASPQLIDMKLRPSAATPFYVSNSVDISKVLVDTLNRSFAPPGPVPALKQGPPPVAGGGAPVPAGQGGTVMPAGGGVPVPPGGTVPTPGGR